MKKTLTLILIAGLLSAIAHAQHKVSMNVKDLNSGIEKYIKTHYEGYKISEAFMYEVAYEMVIHKGDSAQHLLFDSKGKFVKKKAEADNAKMALQSKNTMAVKDVDSDIENYIEKNYKDYKLTESFRYDEVYTAKIVNKEASEVLAFNKDGKFIKLLTPAKPAHNPADTTHHAKQAPMAEPAKTDTGSVK